MRLDIGKFIAFSRAIWFQSHYFLIQYNKYNRLVFPHRKKRIINLRWGKWADKGENRRSSSAAQSSEWVGYGAENITRIDLAEWKWRGRSGKNKVLNIVWENVRWEKSMGKVYMGKDGWLVDGKIMVFSNLRLFPSRRYTLLNYYDQEGRRRWGRMVKELRRKGWSDCEIVGKSTLTICHSILLTPASSQG